MFFCEQDGPGQSCQRNSLVGAAGAQGLIDRFDFMVGFREQPVAEIPVDLMTTLMQFVRRHFMQFPGSIGGKKFLSKPFREFFRMIFDEMNEAECNHGRPPATAFSYCTSAGKRGGNRTRALESRSPRTHWARRPTKHR